MPKVNPGLLNVKTILDMLETNDGMEAIPILDLFALSHIPRLKIF